MTVWLWFASTRQRVVFYTGLCAVIALAVVAIIVVTGDGPPSDDFLFEHWPWVLLVIAIVAPLFGVFAVSANAKPIERFADTIRDLTPDGRRVAYKASIKGAIPSDPDVRTGALRICEVWLDTRRQRNRAVFVLIGLVVILQLASILNTLTSGGGLRDITGAIALLAVFAGALSADAFTARRFRKRQALLASAV